MTMTHKLGSAALVAALSVIALGAERAPLPPAPTTLRALYGLRPPSRFSRAHTALLLIDFQDEFVHGRLPLPEADAAVSHANTLLGWARQQQLLVIHVQQVSSKADSPVFAPRAPGTRLLPLLAPRPGELLLSKSLLGAFSRTNLQQELQSRGVNTLVIAGLMTHLAVQATAADAVALGYHAVVAGDAVATRALPGAAGLPGVDAATLQRATLASIADRLADVLTTQDIARLPVAE